MKALLATILVSTFAWSATAQSTVKPDDAASRTKRAARPVSTLTQLNTVIPEVAFEDLPFDQVIDWLSGYTGMNVVVRWQTLTDAGINRDKPITIKVKNLRLSQVLWMIMNEAGGTDLKLAYRASGNLLVLSTEEDLGKEMLVRVYEVSDLLIRPPYFRSAPQIDIQQAGQGGGGAGGGGSSGNIFGGGSGGGGGGQEEDDQQNQGGQGGDNDRDAADVGRLIELIVQTVQPDSWEANGGVGTIRAWRRMVVVRNNILVHQQLGGPVTDSAN